jgi:hypothetical protein
VLADPLFFREAASREVVVAGGLISYGASFSDLFRRAATYVDISKHAGRVKSERVLG